MLYLTLFQNRFGTQLVTTWGSSFHKLAKRYESELQYLEKNYSWGYEPKMNCEHCRIFLVRLKILNPVAEVRVTIPRVKFAMDFIISRYLKLFVKIEKVIIFRRLDVQIELSRVFSSAKLPPRLRRGRRFIFTLGGFRPLFPTFLTI